MNRQISAFIGLICLFGCTPQKRMAFLLKHNPELAKHDTTRKVIADTTKAIAISFDTPIDTTGSIKLDSLIQMYVDATEDLYSLKMNDSVLWKHTKDSIVKKSNGELYKYIANYKFLKDTVRKVQDDITVKAWQEGKSLRISINKPEVVNSHTVTTISNNINSCPPCEPKWYDVGSRWLNLFFLLIISLISYLYFKSKK